MFNDANPLDRRAEDRAASDDEDDTAIALTLDTLGEIEGKVFTINGFNAEARQALRELRNLLGPGRPRRLADRACRALDDALRTGGDLVAQTRGL